MTTLSVRAAVPVFALFALAASAALPTSARAQVELITNGTFETGTLQGYTLANQLNPSDTANADHFYVSTPGSNTPAVNSVTFTTASNAQGGSFYAVTASDLPGAHALLQNFVVPTNTTALQMSFQMFVNDQSGIGPQVDPSGLDYTTGGLAQPNDNQHARVDILRANAADLSTSSSDIVTTLYGPTVDAGTFDQNGNLVPNAYKTYSFNLTNVLSAGQTYRLRFAEVDNDSAINLGVDNISLRASVAPVPEPTTLATLASLGVLGSTALLRRARRTR